MAEMAVSSSPSAMRPCRSAMRPSAAEPPFARQAYALAMWSGAAEVSTTLKVVSEASDWSRFSTVRSVTIMSPKSVGAEFVSIATTVGDLGCARSVIGVVSW